MKVLLVNHSDTLGGASVVSRRLLDALVEQGVDARMLVTHISPEGERNPRIALACSPKRRKKSFLAEEGWIYLNNGFSRRDLFKVDAGRFGVALDEHPWVREADVVMLNWVNQGMLSLDGIGRIAEMGKKIVWTMHDMWPVTGICHHAKECREYQSEEPCQMCQYIDGLGRFVPQLSSRVARRKIQLYDRIGDKIDFVAVSRWLAECAEASVITRGRMISMIHNAFPVEAFHTRPRRSRRELGLPEEGAIVVMGAARLDDPVKNLKGAIEALDCLSNRVYFEQCPPVTAVFFGALRDPSALNSMMLPYVWLGPIDDKERIADIYAHAAGVMSTSLYETLPGTLIEGQAAGAWPVSYDRGGQRDIISDDTLGTVAPFGDEYAFADGLMKAVMEDSPERREYLRASVREKFSAESVAKRYVDLLTGC